MPEDVEKLTMIRHKHKHKKAHKFVQKDPFFEKPDSKHSLGSRILLPKTQKPANGGEKIHYYASLNCKNTSWKNYTSQTISFNLSCSQIQIAQEKRENKAPKYET